jgi:hypothetical protein
MAKKKGGKKKGGSKGGKKKGGKKCSSSGDAQIESAHAFHHRLQLKQRSEPKLDWVKLKIVLVNWTHMTFELVVRATSSMHAIARMIQEKTGSVTDLHLYKSPPHHSNEIVDFDTTVLQFGFAGGPRHAAEEVTFYYDFKPRVNDSLLLAEPSSWRFVDATATPDEAEAGTAPEGTAGDSRTSSRINQDTVAPEIMAS